MKLYKKLFFGTLACATLLIFPLAVTSCSENNIVNPTPSVPGEGSDWKKQPIISNTNPQIFIKYKYAPSDAAKTVIPEEKFMELVNNKATIENQTLINNNSQLWLSVEGDVFTSKWDIYMDASMEKTSQIKKVYLTPETSGVNQDKYKLHDIAYVNDSEQMNETKYIDQDEWKKIVNNIENFVL